MRERAGNRGLLRAYRSANLGFGGREDLLAVLDLVVNGLGGSKEGFSRSFAEQVVLEIQFVEDIASRGSWLNLDVLNVAGPGNDDS